MAESNQKHMKPSWATGQTVSIREESIIDNGSFLGGQFSFPLCHYCSLSPSRRLSQNVFTFDAPKRLFPINTCMNIINVIILSMSPFFLYSLTQSHNE